MVASQLCWQPCLKRLSFDPRCPTNLINGFLQSVWPFCCSLGKVVVFRAIRSLWIAFESSKQFVAERAPPRPDRTNRPLPTFDLPWSCWKLLRSWHHHGSRFRGPYYYILFARGGKWSQGGLCLTPDYTVAYIYEGGNLGGIVKCMSLNNV